MIFTSYDVFLCKDVPFVDLVANISHLEGQIPQNPILGAWIGIFNPKWQNKKTCILSKLLAQFQPNFAKL